jgi:hypothetical protein
LPVDPRPCWLSRSITNTLRHPACVRCQATLDPTMPPPIFDAGSGVVWVFSHGLVGCPICPHGQSLSRWI